MLLPQQQTNKTVFIRILMLACWVGLIVLFLYLPTLLSWRLQAQSINVFSWSGLFDTQYIAKFEKETGIKVNFSYYESNEELLVKLKATGGRGYDLIVPSDYTVNVLRRENLLQKIDKSKLDFYSALNKTLLNHYFDPENNYSIPFEWAVFGLGIDKAGINSQDASQATWGLVFDKSLIKSKIVMINDPLVAIPLAAFYLFQSLNDIDQAKLEQIKALLLTQKKWVEAYADFRADYMIVTKNAQVAVASSSYIWRSMKEYTNIDFIVPKEGSLVTVESLALPVGTTKQDLVYKFINFMYKPETVEHQFKTFAFFPVTTDVLPRLQLTDSVRKLLTLSPEEFKQFDFFRYDYFKAPITPQTLQDLWVTVKS
ncbi:spermidine/putrescine ABC transporter substrate-binding protein [Candidatus Dependentiae bacterium]|nr:spermidine/putrescine ABC transporter substrate-binding protein [Candidatus Dependentiae bacterium]